MTAPRDEAFIRTLGLMATGGVDELAEVVAPDATDREAREEPLPTRGQGPDAFHATALWLRTAHSDLGREVHDAVQDGELVVLHTTTSGRQTGPFTAYDEDAVVAMVFPPTPIYLVRMLLARRRARREVDGSRRRGGRGRRCTAT